jgi:integrase
MPKLPTNLVKRGRTYVYRELVDRKVVRVSLGEDKDVALAELARIRSLKNKAGLRLSVKEASQQWLLNYVASRRPDAKNQRLAAQRVRDFLEPCLGHLLLWRLSRLDLDRYLRWLTEEKSLSVQSVRHILADCRCFLLWCVDAELLDRSPFPKRFLPRVQERPPDRLADAELEKVCSVEDPYGFVCRFLALTGLRWGEFIRAQVADIRDSTLVVSQTKSMRVRRVPLPASLLSELRSRVGRISPLEHSGEFAKRVRSRSGVGHFHAHQLRHTFACRWLEAGGSLAALQEILGHASIVTTQRYGRLSDAHVQAEAARIGERLVTRLVTAPLRVTS